MKAFPETERIKGILNLDDLRVWKQDSENPNVFTSSTLGIMHIHKDKLKYWETLQALSNVKELPVNISVRDLLNETRY